MFWVALGPEVSSKSQPNATAAGRGFLSWMIGTGSWISIPSRGQLLASRGLGKSLGGLGFIGFHVFVVSLGKPSIAKLPSKKTGISYLKADEDACRSVAPGPLPQPIDAIPIF